jgi:hypothetical protein
MIHPHLQTWFMSFFLKRRKWKRITASDCSGEIAVLDQTEGYGEE